MIRPVPLAPDPHIGPEDRVRGRQALVQDAAWASLLGGLYGGVVLVGFALELGATPLVIGVLGAIPLLAQLAQLPAIVLVEHVRERRKIAVLLVGAARVLILALALLPWLAARDAQLGLLLAAQIAIALLGAAAGCAINSWWHQLLAAEELGNIYSRRLFWSTVLAALGALAAGQLVEHWPYAERLHAYAVAFAVAAVAGFVGLRAIARIPEPVMYPAGAPLPIVEMLRAPFRDAEFRRVIIFMAAWNVAANIAAPFLTVYLLQQLGYGLGIVTTLWAVSQVANAITLLSWGRLSDRLSNKAILAVALPAYFASLIALPISAMPDKHVLTLPFLFVIHIVMGIATGGIGLATGNIGLKLAPQGKGTSYLAAVTLAGSLAGGLAAFAGGVAADWFASRSLSLYLQWSSAAGSAGFTVIQFRHWEFLFAISFLLGIYVLHALSLIREGEHVSERTVMQQFLLEAARVFEQLPSIAFSSLVAPFGRLIDRRRTTRSSPQARS
jgi:MFS family permease